MKILIATDGSDFSRAAIRAGRKFIAPSERASVKIISAVERPMPIAAEPFAVSAEYYHELEQAGRRQAQEFVEQAQAELRSFFPKGDDENATALDLTTEVVFGAPAQAIVEKAIEWGADLIVVSSHGYGFWSRVLLGSVSNAVVQHAPCSVLVARERSSSGGGGSGDK